MTKRYTDFTIKQWAMVLACVSYMVRALKAKALEQTGTDMFSIKELEEIEQELNEMLRPYRKR